MYVMLNFMTDRWFIVIFVTGSLKERTKLKVIKRKKKAQDGIKCVQCMAISTDGKFLVRLKEFYTREPYGWGGIAIFRGDTYRVRYYTYNYI